MRSCGVPVVWLVCLCQGCRAARALETPPPSSGPALARPVIGGVPARIALLPHSEHSPRETRLPDPPCLAAVGRATVPLRPAPCLQTLRTRRLTPTRSLSEPSTRTTRLARGPCTGATSPIWGDILESTASTCKRALHFQNMRRRTAPRRRIKRAASPGTNGHATRVCASEARGCQREAQGWAQADERVVTHACTLACLPPAPRLLSLAGDDAGVGFGYTPPPQPVAARPTSDWRQGTGAGYGGGGGGGGDGGRRYPQHGGANRHNDRGGGQGGYGRDQGGAEGYDGGFLQRGRNVGPPPRGGGGGGGDNWRGGGGGGGAPQQHDQRMDRPAAINTRNIPGPGGGDERHGNRAGDMASHERYPMRNTRDIPGRPPTNFNGKCASASASAVLGPRWCWCSDSGSSAAMCWTPPPPTPPPLSATCQLLHAAAYYDDHTHIVNSESTRVEHFG